MHYLRGFLILVLIIIYLRLLHKALEKDFEEGDEKEELTLLDSEKWGEDDDSQ